MADPIQARLLLPILAVAALWGCGEGQQTRTTSEALKTFDVQEGQPPPAPGAPGGSSSSAAPVAVAVPRIAYTYSYTFRLGSEAVRGIQERHLDLCERLGPARCRVVKLERSASSGDYVTAGLTLQVAAPLARRFGQQLVASATETGAETTDRGIEAEDLTKQMVDTQARIRMRETLVRRLTTLLETRSGNIQQAVEAERAINNAQEELEAARGYLSEMQNRVAMSTFVIRYASGAPLGGGASDPLRGAIGEVGSLFGRSLAMMITLLGALLPWVLLGLLIWWGMRAARRRGWIRGRRRMVAPAPQTQAAGEAEV
jgi:hypothetical protein